MPTEIISRAEARAKDLKRYFTGKPCVNGHVAFRWTNSCICHECHHALSTTYRENNREKHNSWGSKNPEKRKVSQDRYVEAHPDRRSKSQLGWIARNRDRHREYQRGLRKRLRQTDADWRLRANLRGRLRKALVRASAAKSGKTMDLIGCTVAELKKHLRRQFTEGMTWRNYGHGPDKWNVDHRVPCAAFDLTDPEQQRQCFHFTNLQPMWHPENVAKGDRIVDAQTPAF